MSATAYMERAAIIDEDPELLTEEVLAASDGDESSRKQTSLKFGFAVLGVVCLAVAAVTFAFNVVSQIKLFICIYME